MHKYKTLIDQGKWEAPDTQQAQIIALQKEINTLKTKSKGGSNDPINPKGKRRSNRKYILTNQAKQRSKRD